MQMETEGTHLYHGAGAYALAAIVQSNTLLEGVYWGKPGEPHGPRTSRSFTAASAFITYNVHWGEGGVIVLDRIALARDYAIQSYVDTVSGDYMEKEQEEVILAKAVTNLDRYLVSIVCDPEVIKTAKLTDCLEAARSECGWAFEHEEDDLARAALDQLLVHPKLNAWVPAEGYPFHGNWPEVAKAREFRNNKPKGASARM